MDLRTVLTRLNIDWIDRGANTSRGHVNITCPYCSDPSHHLSIDETNLSYYCLREGWSSARRDIVRLLVKASGQSREHILVLVGRPGRRRVVRQQVKVEPLPQGAQPLNEGSTEFAYVALRLECSLDWVRVVVRDCKLLRFAAGRLSYRAVAPLVDAHGDLAGYTGRACYPNQKPRYLTVGAADKAVFLPSMAALPRSVLLVEGPFDAIKIYSVLVQDNNTEVLPIALLGMQVSPEKCMAAMGALITKPERIFYVPDADVGSFMAAEKLRALSAPFRSFGYSIKLLRLPEGPKDAGEASPAQIRWLLKEARASV